MNDVTTPYDAQLAHAGALVNLFRKSTDPFKKRKKHLLKCIKILSEIAELDQENDSTRGATFHAVPVAPTAPLLGGHPVESPIAKPPEVPDVDPVRLMTFVAQRCRLGSSESASRSEIYEEWIDFTESDGVELVSENQFLYALVQSFFLKPGFFPGPRGASLAIIGGISLRNAEMIQLREDDPQPTINLPG